MIRLYKSEQFLVYSKYDETELNKLSNKFKNKLFIIFLENEIIGDHSNQLNIAFYSGIKPTISSAKDFINVLTKKYVSYNWKHLEVESRIDKLEYILKEIKN